MTATLTPPRNTNSSAFARDGADSVSLADLRNLVARAGSVVGLGAIALVHLLDLQGKIKEVPYLGVGYIVMIAASIVAAAMLVHRDSKRGWILGGGVALVTLIGFVINRTIGLPNAKEDIGNWLEPLGVASLFAEGVVVALAAYVLARPAQ